MSAAYRFNRTSGEIRRARRFVGTVRPHPTSASFVGRIGQHVVESYSAETAFREVAARALGFASAADLRQRNSVVRASNRARRGTVRRGRRGTFNALDALLGRIAAPTEFRGRQISANDDEGAWVD